MIPDNHQNHTVGLCSPLLHTVAAYYILGSDLGYLDATGPAE